MRKGAPAVRRESEVGFEQPVKFQQRLFIKHHISHIFYIDSGVTQAECDRLPGVSGVILDPAEPFLLCGSRNSTVFQQYGGGIMVKCGNP